MADEYVDGCVHGDEMHIFFDKPSTKISIFVMPTLSEAVAVIVTCVDVVMLDVGECVTLTVGGIVSVPIFWAVMFASLQHPAELLHDGPIHALF